MNIKKAIGDIIRKTVAFERGASQITDTEIQSTISSVIEKYDTESFDFSKSTSLKLNRDGKKRIVKRYEATYSPENILCQIIKQILDKSFKIRYPNRNKTIRELFSLLPATIQMSDFTMVKFDFKDYFNSVSSIYVFEKYIKSKLLDRQVIDLIQCFVNSTKYAYAGFCTSNAIAEIIAKEFDKAINHIFNSNSIIYYERYVDDCILILNEDIAEQKIKEKLENIRLSIFHDTNIVGSRCHTKFNEDKFKYISRRTLTTNVCSIDFLGYEFFLSLDPNREDKIVIQYGITESKRKKYQKKLEKLIHSYKDQKSEDYNNIELLRHRLIAFVSRVVYLNKCGNSNIWKVRGFISNYGELRYFLDTAFIERNTKDFLEKMVYETFSIAELDTLYFIVQGTDKNSGYNLYHNMKVNKTILFVDHIGYDYKSLVKLCKQIRIDNVDSKGEQKTYGSLVKEYLIKVKVGY